MTPNNVELTNKSLYEYSSIAGIDKKYLTPQNIVQGILTLAGAWLGFKNGKDAKEKLMFTGLGIAAGFIAGAVVKTVWPKDEAPLLANTPVSGPRPIFSGTTTATVNSISTTKPNATA